MFSSKTTYRVFIQLHLEDDERDVIEQFSPYQPDPIEGLNLGEYEKEMWEGRLRKKGLLTFVEGVEGSFDSIQRAGKFEDAVLRSFSEYAGQISSARARASVLGIRREVDIK